MANPTGKSYFGRFGVHIAVLFFVALWTLPTLGILVSSLRDKDQIIVSGWWTALTSSTQTEAGRLPPPNTAVEKDGKFVLEGNLGSLPFWMDARISRTTVLYAVALTVLGAIIAGVLPALRVTRGLGVRLRQATA